MVIAGRGLFLLAGLITANCKAHLAQKAQLVIQDLRGHRGHRVFKASKDCLAYKVCLGTTVLTAQKARKGHKVHAEYKGRKGQRARLVRLAFLSQSSGNSIT
jgi:hypothetical protein